MFTHCLLAAALGTTLFLSEPEAVLSGDAPSARVNPAVWSLDAGEPVQLNLADGPPLALEVQGRIRHPTGNVTWIGRAADPGMDGFLVTLTGSATLGLFGTVLSPYGEFRIAPAGRGWNEVTVRAVHPPASATRNDIVWHGAVAHSSSTSVAESSATDDAMTVLNVLLLYSTSARAGMNDAQWTAYLDDLFAVINDAYARSGTMIGFQRVADHWVDASESATSNGLLDQLMPVRAGFDAVAYGEVEDWRVAADAHLVLLLRDWQPSHFNCGAAALQVCGDDAQCYNASQGYSVSSLGTCSVLVIAHELGHNLGSAHEPGDEWPGTYSYSHGHVTPANANTVMAKGGATLLARFSSPQLDCGGHPCGIDHVSDNVRSLRQTRHYIARWLTDRSISFFEPQPASVIRGMAMPVNFTWFGVLTTRFDFVLHRHGAPVAVLATGESLPAGFKLLAMPASIETGPGYSIRLSSTDLPQVFADSAEFEVVEPAGPPSEFAFGTATVTVPAGATFVELEVRRGGDPAGLVTVDFATQDGTALAGTHYTATSGAFAWGDGDNSVRVVTVAIAARMATGQLRSFTVRLSDPSAGSLLGTPAMVTVTIPSSGGDGRGGGGAVDPIALAIAGLLAGVAALGQALRREPGKGVTLPGSSASR